MTYNFACYLFLAPIPPNFSDILIQSNENNFKTSLVKFWLKEFHTELFAP